MTDDQKDILNSETVDEQFVVDLVTLPSIFRNRFLTVPDYQRGYSWDEKHVSELLKDMEHLIRDGIQLRHYTGTLVLSPRGGNNEGEFYIVDGQQRLTTLVIIMHLLIEEYSHDDRPKLEELYIRRGNIGNTRTVLRLSSDHRKFFERVILGDEDLVNEPPKLEAHNRLFSAKALIRNWIKEQLEMGDSVDNIQNTVEKELGFLVYAPEDSAETGIMFEVINNRGKPLSELEKVKNYLIYCSVKLSAKVTRRMIDTCWSDILSNLNTAKKTSPGEEGAFLRYCVAVQFELNKSDSQYGYDQIKKRLSIDGAIQDDNARKSILEKIAEFVRFLEKASLWYARLYGQQHEGLEEILVHKLNLIRAQERHASIMPLFLSLVIKNQGTGEILISLLNLVEILNFRVYMARNMTARNDTGQGELFKFASQYYHDKLTGNKSEEDIDIGTPYTEDESLEYCLIQFINKYSGDSRFKSSFILEDDSPDDFYRWSGLRYFLMNYEGFLQPHKTISIDKILLSRREGKSADYLSVEHIWALENRVKDGQNNRKEDSHERRRLGNFILLDLRLNIQLQREWIELKIPKYLKGYKNEPRTDLEQVIRMGEEAERVKNKFRTSQRYKNYYLNFSKELNTRLERNYIEFAEERWSIKDYIGYEQLSKMAITSSEES